MKNLFSTHGGKLDAVIHRYGGKKSEWLDLSTGINPKPYPFKQIDKTNWNRLPDDNDFKSLYIAARNFWDLPKSSLILGAPGVSSLIALIPLLQPFKTVSIQKPTYSEYETSFKRVGCKFSFICSRLVIFFNSSSFPDIL